MDSMVFQFYGIQMYVVYSCIGVIKIIFIFYLYGKYVGYFRKKLSLDLIGCRGERLVQQRKGQFYFYVIRKCGLDFEDFEVFYLFIYDINDDTFFLFILDLKRKILKSRK